MAVNAIIALGLYLVITRYAVHRHDAEREGQLARAVDNAVAAAQSDAKARGAGGCHAVFEPGGHVVLDLAEVLAHRDMLGLTADQVDQLGKARAACERACSQAVEGAPESEAQRVSEHARRVLDALSCLTARQLGLIDEWLGGATLRSAANGP